VAAVPSQVPGVGPAPPADLSAQIGQVLYSLALEAAGNGCGCGPCQKARKLAGLLAKQLEAAGGRI